MRNFPIFHHRSSRDLGRAKAVRNLHKASAEVDASDSTSAPNRRAPLSRSNPRAKFCRLTHGRADANLESARSERDNVSIDPLIDGLAFPEPGKPWYALVAGRVKEHGLQHTVLFEGPSNTGNLGKKAFGQLNYCQIWLVVAGTHVNKL